MVICLFGIHWAMLHRVIELLASWKGKFSWQKIYLVGGLYCID